MVSQICLEIIIDDFFHFASYVAISKFSFCLPLELRFRDLDGDDSIQSVGHVRILEFSYFLIDLIFFFSELVDDIQ